MDLSIVFGGRDDNYGETFIERLEKALDYNIRLLDESGLEYEIIAVDYNPIGEKYLYENDLLKSYLKNKSCLLYTSPSPRDNTTSRMPSSA